MAKPNGSLEAIEMESVRRHTVLIEETEEQFLCGSHESVLLGMERLGKKGIPVGCRGGGCGICIIEVVAGSFTKRPMSREFISETDEQNNCVLACRVKPTSDLTVRVLGKMRKNVCRTATVLNSPTTVLALNDIEIAKHF
jgi:ferredoxin